MPSKTHVWDGDYGKLIEWWRGHPREDNSSLPGYSDRLRILTRSDPEDPETQETLLPEIGDTLEIQPNGSLRLVARDVG